MKCVKLLVGNDSMNLHPKDYMEWHVRNLPRGCNKAFLLNRKARHFDSEYVATSNLVHLKLWIGRIRTEWRNIDHCLKRHYSVRILLKAYNHQVVLKKHYANLKVNRFGNVAGQMHLFVLLPCFFGVAEHLTECSSTLSFISHSKVSTYLLHQWNPQCTKSLQGKHFFPGDDILTNIRSCRLELFFWWNTTESFIA